MTAHAPTPHDYNQLNQHSLNRRSAEILRANAIAWSPATELASVALMRHALEADALILRTVAEPDLLLAQIQANPEQTLELLTQTSLGEPFEINLDPNPIQAAAQLLEELLASLTALSPAPNR